MAFFHANTGPDYILSCKVKRYSGGTIGFNNGTTTINLCQAYVGDIIPDGTAATLRFKCPATSDIVNYGMIFWYSRYSSTSGQYGNTGYAITPTSTGIEDGYYYATFSIPASHQNYVYFYPFINDANGTTVPTPSDGSGTFYVDSFANNTYGIRSFNGTSWVETTNKPLWKRTSGSWNKF